MGLFKLLTNPGNFEFYWQNQVVGSESPNSINPREIPFGKDRANGGSSKQPYHKVNYRKKFELGTEGLAQTGGSDLILRGGYLTFGVPGYANSRWSALE